MKKSFAVAAILLFVAVAVLLSRRHTPALISMTPVTATGVTGNPSAPANNSAAASAVLSSGTGANPTPPNDLASHAASPNPPPSADSLPVLPPLTVLDNARVAMHNYCATFGENPVGTNPEITAALMGKNPRQVNFITPESGLRVNANGEMVDGYGTPFFFHQLSGKEMEIRSAGEDRKLWTFDDQVTR